MTFLTFLKKVTIFCFIWIFITQIYFINNTISTIILLNSWLIWIKFFYDLLSTLVAVNHFLSFYSNVLFNFFFLCIISSFVLYTIISIESSLLTLLVLNLILLSSSINTSCFWFLNLYCDFNISLLSFMNSL